MIKKNCLTCKKEFKIYPSRIKRNRGSYCSLKCKYKASESWLPWNKNTVKKKCKTCNKEYERSISLMRGGYCSKKCAYEARKGIKPAHDKGFKKTSLLTLIKVNPKLYYSIHKKIRKLFGTPTKCEDCGADNLHGREIHWANISGEYLFIRTDWKRLCKGCHAKWDLFRRRRNIS